MRFKTLFNSSFVHLILLLAAAGIVNSCVYYNTFYLARKNFNQAESSREKANRDLASGGEISGYQEAIKKASKVLSEHPGSSWFDDALFVIGKSFYYLGDYAKAERKFRELLSNFPDSKFADESRFFLGKSRYRLENYLLAKEVFQEFIESSKNDEWRAEALYLMAEMSAEQDLDEEAIGYYQQFVAKYKSNFRTREIYYKIGQLMFESEKYQQAAEYFALAAEAAEEAKPKFEARYREGSALYRIDSIQAGLALFEKLKSEQEDSVYLGNVLLRIAEGKNLLGEERESILLYDEIATNFVQRIESAEAYYQLGQIAQNDWGDLVVAKDMYEMASKEQRGGDWRVLAQEKVSDIRKVETYLAAMSSDTTGSSAENRYLLAEMYRTDLNRPDSALQEYKTLVETEPESELAPRSLLAMGWILENHFHDSTAARSYYQQVVDRYPRSDALQKAVEELNLQGAEPYEFSPDKLYGLAEDQLFDAENLDSAKVLFQKLIDDFPTSRLVPKADFALAKIQLMQFVPATKAKPQPKVEEPAIDSSKLAAGDSMVVSDSAKLPILIDSVSVTSSDSLRVQNAPDTLQTQVPSDTGNGRGAMDTTKTTVKSDSNKTTAPVDSNKNAQADDIVRLADLIGRKDGVSRDTAAAAARRNSELAARNAVSDTIKVLPTPDTSRVTPVVDSGVVVGKSDSSGVAKVPRDSLSQKSAPKDTVFVDSTMILVFKKLAEKYAGTEIGDESLRLASGNMQANSRLQQQEQMRQEQLRAQREAAHADSLKKKDSTTVAAVDTLTLAQQKEQLLKEEIEKWPLMDDEPSVVGEFTYPVEASTSKFEGRIVVKIKIEFDGKVSEVTFLKGSNITAMDQEIEKALLDTYFDTLKIDPLKLNGKYFIYYYEIVLPEVYR